MSLIPLIEAYLFTQPEAVGERQIAKVVNGSLADVRLALKALQEQYRGVERGIHLLEQGEKWQLVTSVDVADILKVALSQEETSELTRPSLETLSIIASRGPVSRVESEYVRGVHSSLILRNLMIRGLVDETGEAENPQYTITPAFLRSIGVTKVEDMPKYAELHDKPLEELTQQLSPQ
ncbi:MAG: SMC-Scp complex subunit ScpB [bacterium]|nr:SMC-Scp complex subunit ScpB [bacterium]